MVDVKNTDDFKQLMLLKQMTATTGLLHSAQLEQLKYYPLILTHCIKCEISVDTENKTVLYKLLKFKGKEPKDINDRFNLLNKWVQILLGDEYQVSVLGYKSNAKRTRRKNTNRPNRRRS